MKNAVTTIFFPIKTIRGSTSFGGTKTPEKPTIVTLAPSKSLYVSCNYFIVQGESMLIDAPFSTKTFQMRMLLKWALTYNGNGFKYLDINAIGLLNGIDIFVMSVIEISWTFGVCY